ncbi:unnamed protein product [Soboliphyme baturini]|uniref:MIF4G domain-containing protein n=1 Tax=Soboliphyme baturini TaxID=241478 RepID=A0A183IY78_9BILA|nr:unnamed protein product [Soboliphyme baturini]
MVTVSKTPSELDLLLNALAGLASTHGEPHICEAYRLAIENSTLISDMHEFAECLHQKWLTERQMISPAVQICRVLGNVDTGSGTFSNLVYCILMNDYKDRYKLRRVSRHFFTNSVQFLFEYFYAKYNSASRSLNHDHLSGCGSGSNSTLSTKGSKDDRSKSLQELCKVSKKDTNFYLKGYSLMDDLVNPMYDYLNMLLDATATESEIKTFHCVMFMMGPLLEELQPQRMHELALNLRSSIIENPHKSTEKAMLIELLEILNQRWKENEISADVRALYDKYRSISYGLNKKVQNEQELDTADEERMSG